MSKTWKTGGRTYDSDRYDFLYHADEDTLYKCVWPQSSFIGPDGYNRSHIDLIIENYYNNVGNILDPTNPFFRTCATLSSERVKFKP